MGLGTNLGAYALLMLRQLGRLIVLERCRHAQDLKRVLEGAYACFNVTNFWCVSCRHGLLPAVQQLQRRPCSSGTQAAPQPALPTLIPRAAGGTAFQ